MKQRIESVSWKKDRKKLAERATKGKKTRKTKPKQNKKPKRD